jgi:hypothetical protein
MVRRITLVCLVMAVALVGATSLHAQGVQTATLIGTVTGPDGTPLPGVTVTATSPALMGERHAVSAGNGDYVIRGLPPGTYTVRFHLEGMQAVEVTAVAGIGVPTRADAQLMLAAAAETIIVTGEAPSALETTTVGANFSAEEVNQLPVLRTPIGVATLAASVTDRTPVAGQVSISGGMAYDNSMMVNGVNIQDPIFGQIGAANALFIEDAIQETQVLSSGISAEYGHFTGGVVNVVTKSGGNNFSGSLRADFTKPDWLSETPFQKDRGLENKGDLSEVYSATLGGPIVRDRVWFFLAGRDTEANIPQTLGIGDTVIQKEENRRYEVKLTGNVTPNHSLQGSYSDNPTKRDLEFQVTPLELASLARDSKRENDGFALSYTGVLTNNLFAEARYSEKKFKFVNTGGTLRGIVDSPIRSLGRHSGPMQNTAGTFNAPYFDSTDPEDRDNDQLYGALSYFLSTPRLGSHDLKIGAERFTVTRTGGNSQTATDYVFYSGYLTSGGQPVRDSAGRLIPSFVPRAPGIGHDTRIGWWVATRGAELDITTDSFFIQDRWNINANWTVNLGVRHEQVRSEATGGIVGVDTDTTVPRLGVSFDPLGNGRYKFDVTYAEYAGRYNPGLVNRNTPVGAPALLYGYYVGPAGSGRDFAPGFDVNNYVFYYASVPQANIFMAPGLASPVNEEFTVSAGMALPRGGWLKATYIDRDLTGVIDNFITIDQGCTNVVFQGVSAGCIDNIFYRNTDVPERKYQAAQLQGRYRLMRNWMIEGNYTHQIKNHGTYEGEGGQSIGTSPFGVRPEIQSPREIPTGRLEQFQEHKVRLWTNYNLELGRAGNLGLGVVYRYDSPLTFSYATSVARSAAQLANDPGYSSRPAQTLFFGDRGIGEFNSTSLFDLALTYAIPVVRNVEPWVKFEMRNVFNDDTLIRHNTGIIANTRTAANEQFCGGPCPLDDLGLPTTFREGALFGQATANTHYVRPREYFIGAGIRF